MIKSDKGDVAMTGFATELLADFSTAAFALKDVFSGEYTPEDAEDMLRKAFEIAFEPEDVIREKTEDVIVDMNKTVLNIDEIRKMVEEMKKGEE